MRVEYKNNDGVNIEKGFRFTLVPAGGIIELY